jgi:hypothetical protein
MKQFAHALEILDLRADADLFGANVAPGLAPASLIVVYEAEGLGQAIHLGKQIVMVEVRSSVEDHERLSSADFAIIQSSTCELNMAFPRRWIGGRAWMHTELSFPLNI